MTDRTTHHRVLYRALPSGIRTEREQHTSVLNDTTNWCLGRPQTTLTTASHTLTGGTAITRTTGQTWDSRQLSPAAGQLEPGNAQWQVTTAYGYDGFGNHSSESVTGIGMSRAHPHAQLRHPRPAPGAGHRPDRPEHDPGLGLRARGSHVGTDPNGLTTTWGNDSFGRRTLETRPDQTRTAWDRRPARAAATRARAIG